MVNIGSVTRVIRANALRLSESYCSLRIHKKTLCDASSLVNNMTEPKITNTFRLCGGFRNLI